MNNPFIFSEANKRYHTFDYYLKHKYGCKVFKVALNAGFTCPNRDGTKGINGCIYCSKSGSGEYAGNIEEDLRTQFENGKNMMLKKWPNGKAIAYFQAYTNTYSSVEYLHKVYDQFIEMDDCLAITIATRPDCLDDDILKYIKELSHKKEVYIELGLQTIHDTTANIINRGYNYKVFLNSLAKLTQIGIKTVVHIINGLPGESKEMMIDTVKALSRLPIFGIKFHCLNVLKDTILADEYKNMNLHILSKEEYLDIVAEQLTYLPPEVVVERINTDAMRKELITPTWNNKKVSVSNDLDKLMLEKDLYQGKNCYKSTNYLLLAHKILLNSIGNSLAIDATLGNGYDSLFLINHYNQVISFDIQDLAIKRSTAKLKDYDNIKIIKDSFINIEHYVTHSIDALIYNLGFLPGSDHKVKTNGKDVIKSLSSLLPLLSEHGQAVIVFYTKHDNSEEYNIVTSYLKTLTDYNIHFTDFNTEIVVDIQKRP